MAAESPKPTEIPGLWALFSRNLELETLDPKLPGGLGGGIHFYTEGDIAGIESKEVDFAAHANSKRRFEIEPVRGDSTVTPRECRGGP